MQGHVCAETAGKDVTFLGDCNSRQAAVGCRFYNDDGEMVWGKGRSWKGRQKKLDDRKLNVLIFFYFSRVRSN